MIQLVDLGVRADLVYDVVGEARGVIPGFGHFRSSVQVRPPAGSIFRQLSSSGLDLEAELSLEIVLVSLVVWFSML